MSGSTLVSTIRTSTPKVVECFRNVRLHQVATINHGTEFPRPTLVVLFTWLGAKERYAYKYVNSWTDRGHDVLHVTTSVRDLLFPRTGAEVTASRVVDFLDSREHKVLVHGLSVGGYLTARVLMAARQSNLTITHLIYDSFTSVSGLKAGVENAVSPQYKGLARAGVKLYQKYADRASVQEAQQFMETTPVKAPALFLHSLADKVATYKETLPVITAQRRVSEVTEFLVPANLQVPHVALMRFLGEQVYMNKLTTFLNNAQLAAPDSTNTETRLESENCTRSNIIPI